MISMVYVIAGFVIAGLVDAYQLCCALAKAHYIARRTRELKAANHRWPELQAKWDWEYNR